MSESNIMDQIWGGFLSKVGEFIAEHAHKKLESYNLSAVETLPKDLKSLVVKASDVEEQIKHAERTGKKKRNRLVDEWLGEVNSIKTQVDEFGTRVESAGFIQSFMNGGEAARLNEQVRKLLQKTSDFGELVYFDDSGITAAKMLIPKIAGEKFESNSKEIWRFLESGKVLSIGVYGMGGVGKSTLVKGIYNRLQETYGERSVFWVTVSQEFTIKSLQDEIARILEVDLLDEDNEDKRAGIVHGALSKRENAVLILDDVWENIDLSKVGCPFSKECCRLIMTTRSSEVCDHIGCQEVIKVQKLGEEEAWKLFHETFKHGKEVILGPDVEDIAKNVAKLCDGLPLGIVTLAASMRGQTTIHAWRNARREVSQSFADHDGIGKVFKVLKYSFDRLHADRRSESRDFNLYQLCFLYLSLYPEDREVDKEKLIGEFISEGLLETGIGRRAQFDYGAISEGLLDTRKSRRAQFDRGHVILAKLVNVCLFQLDHYGRVKMHDLVRGMALKVCEGKYMVRAGDRSMRKIPKEEEWREDVEKVSLMYNGIRRIEDGTSPNCPNLSTLLLSYSPLEFISDSFFNKMQGLCTLDLGNTRIGELPDSLSDLKSLKALLLQDCEKLKYVPYLGNMNALRELNLSYTAIEEVPQGVEELLNLRFLSMEGADELEVLPSGLLGELGSLQYVSFPYHLEASIEEIGNLEELEEFKGAVKSVHAFNFFTESPLCIKSDLLDPTSYLLQVGEVDKYTSGDILFDEYSKVYNKVVILTKCSLADEKVSGQDIELLKMWQCKGLSKCVLDDIKNLTSLRKLIIQECRGTEFILRAQQSLSSLEYLELEALADFKGVIHTPVASQCVFSSLKSLHIFDCNEMRKLGLSVSGFPSLEEIYIMRCVEIEEIFEDEGRGESVALPKLKSLKLCRLPRLKSVCKTTMICNAIEEIHIQDCPKLVKKLPVHLNVPPPPERRIEVRREWWESLKWDTNPDLLLLLQPLLTFLE